MSSPYTGATAAGADPQGYAEPNPQNYAADYTGDLGTPTTEAGRPDVEGVSVGQLMGEVARDLSTLMRQELELAKVEVKAEAKKAGTGAGLFGAGGLGG
jgi:Putative Actinobacterial Holin-X, holin superfamily III